MIKLFKRLFSSKRIINYIMDSSDDASGNYEMLDILAFNCNRLAAELYNTETTDEQQKILNEYLIKADKQHKSIKDFKEDLDWFNVTEPLYTNGLLQGKIVVLDFFTYCCINCMHILPDLKKLEELYTVKDGVVVIGVHSPKFDNEKNPSNILSAVQRHNITHPVVNDGDSTMWMQLKIKCWPTMVILGPRANPLFVLMGEGNYEKLEKYISASVKFYNKNEQLKSHALPLNPAIDLIRPSKLKFPGKIVCSKQQLGSINDGGDGDGSGGDFNNDNDELYALSDTGNHRILVFNSIGNVLHKIGGKSLAGFVDGDFETARFDSPQGLTFLNGRGEIIFVADTENHAIRKIDLVKKTVETIAGTGVQGLDRVGGRIWREQELSSPWDVAIYRTSDMDMSFHMDEDNIPEKNILLIAIAGLHQIWAIFLEEVIWWKYKKYPAGTVVALAGNGKEENRNNSYPQNAAFAQPSGLIISNETKELFIADSESSCIRKLSLKDGKVLAVAGGDRNPLNLFAYGDVDGKQLLAKLQHPLGVTYNAKEQSVYVADTYNHKIKKIDITNNLCSTCTLEFNETSDPNGLFNLSEPGGLCVSPNGERLFVADTNNNRIIIVNLNNNLKVETFELQFNNSNLNNNNNNNDEDNILVGNGKSPSLSSNRNGDLSIKNKTIHMNEKGGELKIKFSLLFDKKLNDELKMTKDAPQKWNLLLPNDKWACEKSNGQFHGGDDDIELNLRVPEFNCNNPDDDELSKKQNNKEEQFIVTFKLNLCAKSVCFPKIFSIILPFSWTIDATTNGEAIDSEKIEIIKIVISDDNVKLL